MSVPTQVLLSTARYLRGNATKIVNAGDYRSSIIARRREEIVCVDARVSRKTLDQPVREMRKFSSSFIRRVESVAVRNKRGRLLALSLSPFLRRAFTRRTLDYQRASLQQKLLAAVSRIEPRSIDRPWGGRAGLRKPCGLRRAGGTDNIDDGQ